MTPVSIKAFFFFLMGRDCEESQEKYSSHNKAEHKQSHTAGLISTFSLLSSSLEEELWSYSTIYLSGSAEVF